MRYQDTINHLSKILNEKQARLSSHADLLLDTLTEENIAAKRQKAAEVSNLIDQLIHLLPENDIPASLIELKKTLTDYSGGQIEGKTLAKILINEIPALKNHRWLGDDAMSQGFNFEEIFAHCRDNSRVPELFDSIIDLLEEIRDSGELDSKSIIDALSKIISTMHIGKATSCFSLDGAWQFLCSFLENYFWAEAKKIPALGSVVEALEATIKETRLEMTKLQETVHTEMTTRVTEQVRLFKNKDDAIFKIYEKTGTISIASTNSSNFTEA